MKNYILTAICLMVAQPSFAWKPQPLTDLQKEVTKENGTEPPFKNEYWDNKKPGIYVDITTGDPLFTSLDKYDSGTGLPSFTKGIDQSKLVLKDDKGFFGNRTEVRSKKGDIHLGHVFDDSGPWDRGGKRYCMNSASLKFIPLEDMQKEGYGDLVKIFKTGK